MPVAGCQLPVAGSALFPLAVTITRIVTHTEKERERELGKGRDRMGVESLGKRQRLITTLI